MDRLIAALPGRADGDLTVCQGVAYQTDQAARRAYDDDYLDKFAAYDPATAAAVNAGRCAFLMTLLPRRGRVLDIGAGDGRFVRAARARGFAAYGYEVIPAAAARLRADGLYGSRIDSYAAVTMWDVIEHLPDPALYLRHVRRGGLLLASLPVFADLAAIRASRHYRPGEHLYYWTADGFVAWVAAYGYRLLARSAHETQAGRDGIGAFAFRRDLF